MPEPRVFAGLMMNDLVAHLRRVERTRGSATMLLLWDVDGRQWAITEPAPQPGERE